MFNENFCKLLNGGGSHKNLLDGMSLRGPTSEAISIFEQEDCFAPFVALAMTAEIFKEDESPNTIFKKLYHAQLGVY